MKANGFARACCALVCCAVCVGGTSASEGVSASASQSWEDWLGERIGSVKPERADEIAGMLAALENEHAVVLAKREVCPVPEMAVGTDEGITRFAEAVGKKMDCSVEKLAVSYGGTSYAYETIGNVSDGSLRVKLNEDLREHPESAKARIVEIMAGRTVNRNMVGADKPADWHRRLNDVQAVCLGFGDALLSAVRSDRKKQDDGIDFTFRSPTAMDAVEVAWTMCAVAKLRKQELPTPEYADIAANVAFGRGAKSLLANERRMKIIVKVSLLALEDGKTATMPPSLPAWDTIVDGPVPAVVEKKKRMLDYWAPVPTPDELAKAQSEGARRFLDLRSQFGKLVDGGAYADATHLFSELCTALGADFVLAAAEPSASKEQAPARNAKLNLNQARWFARLSEVREARNYLRANEDVLSGREANFYHHFEAAQCFVILGDENRFLDEMSHVDRQSEQIVSVMRGTASKIPLSDQASHGRRLTGSPSEPAFTIAEYWWRQAKGKRKRIMDRFLSLSAQWYAQVVKKSSVCGNPKPEWHRIAEKRAKWAPNDQELRVTIGSEPKTMGTCGVMMPVFEGSRENPLSVLSSRTVTWRNSKKEKTRQEVFFQPRDYWEHKAFVAGWMDGQGNELRVFRVDSLPLCDNEFDESQDNCPTKERLDERIAASTSGFSGDKASLALWASRFYGIEATEDTLVKVPCGKMAKAFMFTTGDLSTGGAFLCTYRKEWLFVELRLAGEVVEVGTMLRKLAIGARTVSWKDSVGGAVGKEGGMTVYTMPGYVIKVNMPRSLGSKFVSRIKPMLSGSRMAFGSYVPTTLEMKPSVLQVFNERSKYDAYVTKATERLDNRTIGMWIGSREELLVMSGMKALNDSVGEDTFRTLRHEAFHQYLFYATGCKANATWYNEGHACFFETSVFSSGSNPLQPTDDKNLRFPKPFYKDAARMARLMPTILTMTQDEFYDGPLKDVNDRYSAAWGLIYFLEKGIKVMDSMVRYERVLPTYLKEIKQADVDWRAANAKAWKGMNLEQIPMDFLLFWSNPEARKAARAYKPSP